ncbi:hypothetical protein V6N13_113185 [Hibiscus sabdariffa]|uniref:Uncharacterized protein n=1 Tax=Hibiscus sabdariffa TaxID=183260 RepID=A0ABR2CTX3_9ROSI
MLALSKLNTFLAQRLKPKAQNPWSTKVQLSICEWRIDRKDPYLIQSWPTARLLPGSSPAEAQENLRLQRWLFTSASAHQAIESNPSFYITSRHIMAESKPNSSSSDEYVKAPNIFERAKEEIEAVIHTAIHKEKHKDIDESTPLDDVKAPNVFERVKEEIEALVETIHQKKESHAHDDERDNYDKEQTKHDKPENGVRSPLGSVLHHEKSPNHHHKETHGRNDDIDETTPLNEVKAPNVFERAKEEIEAIVGMIHQKNVGSNVSDPSSKEEGGFRHCLGVGLEKVCHPFGDKKD